MMNLDQSLYPADVESEIEERFSLPPRCLHVYDDMSGETRCDPDDEPVLRQAMREYVETKVDRLVDLTSVFGAEFTVLVSKVTNWMVSTPESRLRSRTVDRAFTQARAQRDLLNGDDE